MKKRMFIYAVTALASALFTLVAGDVTLEWDHNPPEDQVTQYRIYELKGTTNLVATVPATTNRVTLVALTPGLHTWVATAVNAIGESTFSNQASTNLPAVNAPGAPQMLRVVMP